MEGVADLEANLPRNRFNDGKCDPAGRFWAGSMNMDENAPSASLYALDCHLACRRMLSGVTVSNGLAWSADGKTMFYADSPTRCVRRFDFDMECGEIRNGRTLIHVSSGFPDGMTIDVEDNLWLAQWGAGRVVRYDSRTGREIAHCEFPVSQTSSCCFGGNNLDVLYVTSARQGFSDAKRMAEPLAGGIFSVKTKTRGRPVALFSQTDVMKSRIQT
jgi:sugar lactone lactonase YvrE